MLHKDFSKVKEVFRPYEDATTSSPLSIIYGASAAGVIEFCGSLCLTQCKQTSQKQAIKHQNTNQHYTYQTPYETR